MRSDEWATDEEHAESGEHLVDGGPLLPRVAKELDAAENVLEGDGASEEVHHLFISAPKHLVYFSQIICEFVCNKGPNKALYAMSTTR